MLVLLAGCQGGLGGTSSGSLPATRYQCTPQETRQVVDHFIDSFNRGDTAQLDQVVAGPGQFVWYSTDDPGHRFNDQAYDRTSLMAYFAARHRQHERLVLESFDVNGNNGDFQFRLTRSADDGLPPTAYGGKGEIQCTTMPRTLAVWSMARWPWSPIELLPEAAALILVAAAIGTIILWRRQNARRSASSASARINIPR